MSFLILFVAVASHSAYSQSKQTYHIAKIFHIKSGGGYDYTTVDSASDKLYQSRRVAGNYFK